MYTYSQLNSNAKDKAFEKYCNMNIANMSEEFDSIADFANNFNIKIKEITVNDFSAHIKYEASNENFRDFRKKYYNSLVSDGLYLGESLIEFFKNIFKLNNGDALASFRSTIDYAEKQLVEIYNSLYNDDYINEFFQMNEFSFDEFGNTI